jgi:hypothetical protein
MSISDRRGWWLGAAAGAALALLPGCGPASPRFLTREAAVARVPATHQLEGVASYYAD